MLRYRRIDRNCIMFHQEKMKGKKIIQKVIKLSYF